MKQNSLENLLKQDAPAPDPVARLAARRAALAEFQRVNPSPSIEPASNRRGFFQGLLVALRLSREPDQHGRDPMPAFSRKALYGAAASFCLAIIGSTVVWQTLRHDPEVAQLQAAAAVREAESATTSAGPNDAAAVESTPGNAVSAAAAEQGAAAAAASAAAVPASGPDGKVEAQAYAEAARNEPAKTRDDAQLAASSVEERKLDAGGRIQNRIDSAKVGGAAPVSAAPSLAKEKDGDAQGEEVVVSAWKRQEMVVETPSPVTVIAADELASAPAPHKGVAPPARGRMNNSVAGNLYQPTPVAPPPQVSSQQQVEGNDKFENFKENSVRQVVEGQDNTSTFAADVDTSSYSFVRKMLDQGRLPQKDAVRAEEMINYFDYAWPAAVSREKPFRPTIVVSDSPWGKGRKLVHIGIKGYELPASQRPDANLVMLLDVSGSMDSPDKLPLVKQSMKLLLDSLKPTDTVGIVVYAGAAGMVLPPTKVGEKEKIVAALDSLTPGGSTAGAQGIELAYQLAEKTFRKEGVNRILLCTDGDFNVGIAGTNELKGYVERKRATGIFLSVLGFGQGNYRDELAQALAQNGNGVAAYIDSVNEAQKVLVQQAGSSLFTIAKDVKFQVEFNPATVAEYRLIGYETRALKREDFNNDKVDAGDIGSGHTVTAIYEITPVGTAKRMVDESRYAKRKPVQVNTAAREYGFLKMRYKLPDQDTSQLIEQPILIDDKAPEAIRRDVGFSTAVAGFAQLLRGGQFTGSLSYDDVIEQALATRGEDEFGYRNEFVQLVRKAKTAR